MVSFFFSLVLAGLFLVCLGWYLEIRWNNSIFWFVPLFFGYLGFLNFSLSIFSALTAPAFLGMQMLLLFGLILLIYFKKPAIFHLCPPKIKTQFSQQKWPNYWLVMNVSLISVFLGLVLVLRWYTPLLDADDLLYRAATPLHWIQNKSVFRYETPDERKNIFLMGTGLIYLWPQLFHANNETAFVLFALAYPLSVISIYQFSRLISANQTNQLLTVMLFLLMPYISLTAVNSLGQEIWLGLAILSFLYFLVTDIKTTLINHRTSFMTGMAFAVIPFIKATAWVYGLLFLAYLIRRDLVFKKFLYVVMGAVICLVLTGFGLYSYQNTVQYGHPLGTESLRSGHFAQISIIQIQTHLTRLPFVFFDPPTFSQKQAEKIQSLVGQVSKFAGATQVLPRELEDPWFGPYVYLLNFPNQHFGLGGIVWFIMAVINSVILLTQKKIELSETYSFRLVFFLCTTVVLLQLLCIRWQELSNIPYRHLISAGIISSAFFPLILAKLKPKTGLSFMLWLGFLALIGVSFLQQFQVYFSTVKNWLSFTPMQVKSIHRHVGYDLYEPFLATQQTSQSFLVVDGESLEDYPLFWFHDLPLNTVTTVAIKTLNLSDFSRQLLDQFETGSFTALVIFRNEPLTKLVNTQASPNYERMELIGRFGNATVYTKRK